MKEENFNNKNYILKIFILVIIAFTLIVITARYATDEDFRSYIDVNILRKEVSDTTLSSIKIDQDTNPSVYALGKYITVLSKNNLKVYNQDGKVESELFVNIAVPIVNTNDEYMVIAEKDGQKIYLISGKNILWDGSVEGNIAGVSVNQNGYVSVIVKNSIDKSAIVFFDVSGKELFKTHLSTSYAICSSISTNNKYLAIGDVEYSGAILKSTVKIISAEKAQKDPDNSIIYTYESKNGEIITNINYQDKEFATCMFDSYIQKVGIDSDSRLYDNTDDDLFIDVNFKDIVAILKKQSSGLFSYEYEILLKSSFSKAENLYILNSDLPKAITVTGNNIALNIGNEVQIISSNGWLLKKYTSNNQIKNIVLGDNIAGVVYKNKIDIVNF